MVDIHHHLLPGLDDGSPNLETSVAMARIAADDGITHVVATPHANNVYNFDPEQIAIRISALRSALASEAIPLTIASGCDFHLSYDNMQDAIAHPGKYTLNGGDYLLVELPDYGLSPQLDEAFYELGLAGMKPILTHPERNPTLQRQRARPRNQPCGDNARQRARNADAAICAGRHGAQRRKHPRRAAQHLAQFRGKRVRSRLGNCRQSDGEVGKRQADGKRNTICDSSLDRCRCDQRGDSKIGCHLRRHAPAPSFGSA